MINCNSYYPMKPQCGRKPARDKVGMTEAVKCPDYDRYPPNQPGIMSPMFYNGRVMTRREFAELHDRGLA